ncbi:hypothetical protein J0K78_03790 [Halobacillus sp. GSS1]|uniref:hypothetical protein n=1 Tax=Halobacillus sp. GSS1 TaxID=2815919 RepID=UPI001A8D3F48|nr:hypothetical protein [Halobacillus sp. GSS1]MBN9653378.1 hypothetical protein [Halobacillus sp. GSS1]
MIFIFTLLFGFCILFFPLQGIREFKSEKLSYKIIRLIFIGLALSLIAAGIIDGVSYVNNPEDALP